MQTSTNLVHRIEQWNFVSPEGQIEICLPFIPRGVLGCAHLYRITLIPVKATDAHTFRRGSSKRMPLCIHEYYNAFPIEVVEFGNRCFLCCYKGFHPIIGKEIVYWPYRS